MRRHRTGLGVMAAVFSASLVIVGCGGGGAPLGATSGTTSGGSASSGTGGSGSNGSTTGGGNSSGGTMAGEPFLVWIRDGQLYGMSLVGDWNTNPKLPIQKSPSSSCSSPFIVPNASTPTLLWVESVSQGHSRIKELSIDANGNSSERTVVDNGAQAVDPSGSSDGTIVYASNVSGKLDFQVYVVGQSQPVTANDPQDPGHVWSWQPEISGDGKTILFSRCYWDDHSMDWKQYNVTCSMSRDGSGFRKLISTTERARWNASASKITYIQGDRGHPGHLHYLHQADAGGTNQQRLSNSFSERDPCFSPDGNYVIYSSSGDIVALNLSNMQTIQITNDAASDVQPHCGSFRFPK